MAPQREWFEKDYYKVLGVAEGATAKDITRAYRKLARELHPDANPGDNAAEDRFKEVSTAYEVLGDDAKRKEYDEVRRMGPAAGGFGPGGFGAGGQTFRAEDLGDLGDLFGGMFGRGGRRGGGPSRGSGPQRGPDLATSLTLPSLDAAHGVTTSVHVTSDAVCDTCHGNGARPGTTPQTCPVCNGRGVLDDNQGFFSFSQPCTNCGGRGSIVNDPCPTCRGGGVVRKDREVKVRIPAAVADGQRIKLKGRGGAGRNGGPHGDLYVQVQVQPHPLFARDGTNLTITVPITFAEAALGAAITVPTLDGEPVTIKIPAGTRSGRTFRVRGRGLDAPKHNGAARPGDLLVTVEVAVPEQLTDDERQAVEALAAVTQSSPRAYLGV
jgi:molecular chaperone DnaJ